MKKEIEFEQKRLKHHSSNLRSFIELNQDQEVQIFERTVYRVNLIDKEPPLTIFIRLDKVNEGLHFEVRVGSNPTNFYKLY